MNSQTVEDRVMAVICSVALGNKVENHMRLAQDLGLDSLEMVELQIELEDEFDVEIQMSDIDNFQTVQDVITYMQTIILSEQT